MKGVFQPRLKKGGELSWGSIIMIIEFATSEILDFGQQVIL
jgi:hypothetical protein